MYLKISTFFSFLFFILIKILRDFSAKVLTSFIPVRKIQSVCSLVVTEAIHSLSLRVGTVGGKSTLRMCFYLRCLEGSSRTWVCVCVCDVVLGAEYSDSRVDCQSLMKWVMGRWDNTEHFFVVSVTCITKPNWLQLKSWLYLSPTSYSN